MKSPPTQLLALLVAASLGQHAAHADHAQRRHVTPQDYLVEGLENVEPAYAQFKGKMYAGLVPVENGSRKGNTMFWLFEPNRPIVPDTLVVWLNGGPGCSSFNCGVMMEHSPVTQPLHAAGHCCLSSTPDFGYNEHTWTRATSILYVEHPLGTGFSHANKDPETESDASDDFVIFMLNWYKVFSQFSEYRLYVMGESYAGMFVPSIGHAILQHNKRLSSSDDDYINLQGLSIGNGWMNAYVQGPAVIDYSWWHGLIDEPTKNALHAAWERCMNQQLMEPPFHSFTVQDDCGIMWGVLQAAGQPNAYDISTWDPNVDQVTFSSEWFFNTPLVKEALHAPDNITWHGCRQGEGRRRRLTRHLLYMENDRPINVVPYVAEVLDAGIPVVVYNGDRDMTTNMVGTELCLNEMDWSGKEEWIDADRGLWLVNDYPAGWAKEFKGLTFVVVYNSGHMVPYNQPEPSYDLMLRLLTGKSFLDKELTQIRVDQVNDTNDEKKMEQAMDSNENEKGVAAATGTQTHPQKQYMAVGVTSFIAGVVAALLLIHFVDNKHHKRAYQPVPEVSNHLEFHNGSK